MQYKDIEIFLELVNTRNITKAAENLFLAQSVLSTRLKKLEEELGYELFSRSKGLREIELTVQGREFVSLASRLQDLYDEAAQIKDAAQKRVRIAAPESIYLAFLGSVISDLRRSSPDITIYAETADSSGVYDLMEANKIDFGFASYESAHHNIHHQHFYNQEFCLVSSHPLPVPVDPSTLDPAKEIVFTGGNFSSINLWRELNIRKSDSPRLSINSSLMLGKYLNDLDGWAILPREVAEKLVLLYGVRILDLTVSPESRRIYFLSRNAASVSHSEATTLFLKELGRYGQNTTGSI